MQRVIRDLDALEQMIEAGAFETGLRRIGIEQELVLLDGAFRPASAAAAVIARAGDPRIVPEIARFNVEFNGDPVVLGPGCLNELEAGVRELWKRVEAACSAEGVKPLMTGICPTVERTQLTNENLVPEGRYFALDDGLKRLRGGDYELRIDGADELIVRHPSVMLESVNTSFQVHYQTTPGSFASDYNVSLAVAAPVLAAAVNSPILFGKRLWRETRVAIFQQVVDTRKHGAGQRDIPGRVRFGEKWVGSSVLEVLRADVARFRQLLLSAEAESEDPHAAIREGKPPQLAAWQAFNSQIYRWMRPCYGVGGGVPHLRIENRVFPAGPTIEDEIANAAFWIGLMVEGPYAWPELVQQLEFRDARANFLRAARDGLSAHMTWIGGVDAPIQELLLEEFLPISQRGLQRAGIEAAEAERTIGIVRARTASRKTGARWLIDAAAQLHGIGKQSERLECMTKRLVELQDSGKPAHEWPPLDPGPNQHTGVFSTVSQCMSTDLFTVGEHECIDLVASIMDWERLRHIPVENDKNELVGLISYRKVLRALLKRGTDGINEHSVSAREIMVTDPVCASPDTPTLEAIRMMRDNKVACLPVVEDGRLVGIVSERDYAEVAGRLLERAMERGESIEKKGNGAV